MRDFPAPVWLLCANLGIWLGFPNNLLNFPPLALAWPAAIVFLGLSVGSGKAAFKSGWLGTFPGSVCALYWLCYPVHDVGGLPMPLAIVCACAICAIMALQGGILALAAWRWRNYGPCLLAFLAALAWYLLEYAFAVAGGFPWLHLGGALAPWPVLLQAMHIFGACFTSALWLFGVLACLLSFLPLSRKFSPQVLSLGLCVLVGLFLYGSIRLHNAKDEGEIIHALFVEGNIDQNQKWIPAFQRHSLDTYLKLTENGLREARSGGIQHPLVIWPETALPFFFEAQPDMAREVLECARDSGCPLLFGAPGLGSRQDLPEGAVYNRAFLIGPDGVLQGYYDKVHLVPFGEYLPQWLNIEFLKALLQGVGIYQEGRSAEPLKYGQLALGMLICYEGIFPWLARDRVQTGANIFVDISNDGWFRDSPASRQHLFLTVPRCVEQNRWLLRSTNTGISAVADVYGRIRARGPQFRAGSLQAEARLAENKSFFYHIEPWLPWISLLFFIFAIGLKHADSRKWMRGNRNKNNE